MTLLTSEISRRSVAMVADSAFSDTETGEVRTGGQKVCAVPHLRCALGMWGKMGICPEGWLELVADQAKNCATIEELSLMVESSLRFKGGNQGPVSSPVGPLASLGVQIVGYEDDEYPMFYHVHNGLSESEPRMVKWGYLQPSSWEPTRVNAHLDLPRTFVRNNWNLAPPGVEVAYYQVRNGDVDLLDSYQRQVDGFLAEADPLRGGLGIQTDKGIGFLAQGAAPLERARLLAWQIQGTINRFRVPHIAGPLFGLAFGPGGTPKVQRIQPAELTSIPFRQTGSDSPPPLVATAWGLIPSGVMWCNPAPAIGTIVPTYRGV